MKKIFLIGSVFTLIMGCSVLTTKMYFVEPPKIDTSSLKKIGVLGFEVIEVDAHVYVERNGNWRKIEPEFGDQQKFIMARAVRAIVMDTLSSSPSFELEYMEDLERIRSSEELSQYVASAGERVRQTDAYIEGRLWLGTEMTDGVDVSKQPLKFSISSNEGDPAYTIDTVAFWSYQSFSGSLVLEMRLVDAKTFRVIASTFTTRDYRHKIGGNPPDFEEEIKKYMAQAQSFTIGKKQEENAQDETLEKSELVLPSLEQAVILMAESAAAGFIKKTAATFREREMIIATGGDAEAVRMINLGAYEIALERFGQLDRMKPEDHYNQAL